MVRCPEPGEPGYSEGLALGFLIGVGLRLAGEVGTGLPLVNALRDRFPGLSLDDAGRLARTVAQGMQAAHAIETGAFGDPIPISSAPILSGGPFLDRPGETYYVDAVVEYTTGPGEPVQYVSTRVFGTDPITIGDLGGMIGETAIEQVADSPRAGRRVAEILRIDYIFAGRRY